MVGYSELIDRKKVCLDHTISDIALDWITGDIHIFENENDEIKVVQITDTKFPEHKLFHHTVKNGKLSITDGRKKKIQIGFNLHKTNLEIYLPKKQFDSISIDCTGVNLFVDYLDTIKCKCHLTSGTAKLSGKIEEFTFHAIGSNVSGDFLEIQKVHLQTTATKIDFSGKFSEINVNSTGRTIKVSSSTMLQEIKSTSTGANVKIEIPENDGFSCHLKKLSGNFKSDFSLVHSGDSYIYKNGKNIFSAEIRGGSFSISKI
ncbi:DUF4097 and DUF4098 domain-containing protein YvlB [Lysinibacillus sp. RC46]|uniref:DUF4097 family beta strand repeat-containing protein n=1 Tax=Lysinibacillus sp. RC46 TaxID=3156295 RepID=UPI003513618D